MQREWHLGHIPQEVIVVEAARLLQRDFEGPNLIESVASTMGCPMKIAQKKVMKHGQVTTSLGWRGQGTIWQYAWPTIEGWRILTQWVPQMFDSMAMSYPERSLVLGTTRDPAAVWGDLQGIVDQRLHLIRRVRGKN